MDKETLQSQLNCIDYDHIEEYTTPESHLFKIQYDSMSTIEILNPLERNKVLLVKTTSSQVDKTKIFDTNSELISYICSMME